MLNGKNPERESPFHLVHSAPRPETPTLEKEPAPRVTPVERAAYVRTGGPADEQEVYRLLLLSHAENGIHPADNDRVMFYTRRFLHAPTYWKQMPPGPWGMFGVIGPVGALEGVVMLGLGHMWYAARQHIEEYLIFVDPNYRAGSLGRAKMLVEWMKGRADEFNMKLLSGIMSNHRTEAKCRLYRRMMPKMGEYFLYDPAKDGLSFYSDELTGPGSLVVSSSLAA